LPRLGPAWAALVLVAVLAVLCLGRRGLAFAAVRRDRRQPGVEADAEASLLAATRLFNAHKGTMLVAVLVAVAQHLDRSGGAPPLRCTDQC
jgi:hypothetical protein